MKAYFLFFVVLVCSVSNAQNLVPNGSFEDANICEQNKPCSPSAWFNVVKNSGAYFYMEGLPASTGRRCLSVTIGTRFSLYRQYWETMLLSKLEKGKKYKINISLRGWDADPNLHDIGLYFTGSMIFSTRDTLMQPESHFNFLDANVKMLKNGWFRLEKEFTADSDYQFLIVGNFSSRNYQEIAQKRFSRSPYLGDLVDDIEIRPVEKIACENCGKIRDSLYAITLRHSSKKTLMTPPDSLPLAAKENKVDTLVIKDILFAVDSYKLVDTANLENYRPVLGTKGIKKIRIVGFTDSLGTAAHNLELSQKRATEIGRLISLKFNIPDSLIECEGRGISTAYAEQDRNRRVEIYINY
jgi:outer membrane protein OmpA-like peptidoglycan-associated protein